MELAIPSSFEEALAADQALKAGVYGTIADFNPWLKDSKLFFFPDYTDHGIDHLNQVLATADGLIADGARGLFTPGDGAMIIIATLLHDSAMHLSAAGFESLVKGAAKGWRVKAFDSEL